MRYWNLMNNLYDS